MDFVTDSQKHVVNVSKLEIDIDDRHAAVGEQIRAKLGSSSPTSSSQAETLAQAQARLEKEWQGINCENVGRPGTSNVVNK